jgi:hypothetical protein
MGRSQRDPEWSPHPFTSYRFNNHGEHAIIVLCLSARTFHTESLFRWPYEAHRTQNNKIISLVLRAGNASILGKCLPNATAQVDAGYSSWPLQAMAFCMDSTSPLSGHIPKGAWAFSFSLSSRVTIGSVHRKQVCAARSCGRSYEGKVWISSLSCPQG